MVVYGIDPQVGQYLDGIRFKLCLCNSSHEYFVPHSKKDQSIHTLIFLLLEFHVFCELYLGYSELLGSQASFSGEIPVPCLKDAFSQRAPATAR